MKRFKKVGILALSLVYFSSLVACGETETEDYKFSIKDVTNDDTRIGEEVVFNVSIETNFSLKIDSVTINNEEITDIVKNEDYYTINTGVILNTEVKEFTLTKVEYTNLDNNTTHTYTTSITKIVEAFIDYVPQGTIEITDWGLSRNSYLLKDWESEKDTFYLWFKINEIDQAELKVVDSFKVNGKKYSVLYDESEKIYTLPDIRFDINPTTYSTFEINFESAEYYLDDEVKTLIVNDKKELSFTQGVINVVTNQLSDANKFDAYNKRIEQSSDNLTFDVQIYNPTENALSSGKISTNLGDIEVKKEKIVLTSQNGNYFKYQIKENIGDLVGKIGNTPKELSVNSLTLYYEDGTSENEQKVEVYFPYTYKVDVYTKFITSETELMSIDNQEGSYILLNDISLSQKYFDSDDSLIKNLNGYLNGNKKTISRTNDVYNSLISSINTNGKISDVIYKTALRINNYRSIYTEGTPSNKFTDGSYDSDKDYSKSSVLCGVNNGTVEKVKITGSIYATSESVKGMPLSYDGIVGLNYGTMKDIEISFEHINIVNQSSNYDFKEFSFITYKNYGTINGIVVNKITGQMILPKNDTMVKNINFYFLTKENSGKISNVLFLETFVTRLFNGTTYTPQVAFSPYIDQFFFFPIKESEDSSLTNYYYSKEIDDTRETYFGNVYNGRPTYTYLSDNQTEEGQEYLKFEAKYGSDVLEKVPGFEDSWLEDGKVRKKKFWTKYLINDYVYGATDDEGNPLFRQDITRVGFATINTSLYETVFKQNTYKNNPSWTVEEPNNTVASTIHLAF